eukprot:749820-Rhodomonas_salina.1
MAVRQTPHPVVSNPPPFRDLGSIPGSLHGCLRTSHHFHLHAMRAQVGDTIPLLPTLPRNRGVDCCAASAIGLIEVRLCPDRSPPLMRP